MSTQKKFIIKVKVNTYIVTFTLSTHGICFLSLRMLIFLSEPLDRKEFTLMVCAPDTELFRYDKTLHQKYRITMQLSSVPFFSSACCLYNTIVVFIKKWVVVFHKYLFLSLTFTLFAVETVKVNIIFLPLYCLIFIWICINIRHMYTYLHYNLLPIHGILKCITGIDKTIRYFIMSVGY